MGLIFFTSPAVSPLAISTCPQQIHPKSGIRAAAYVNPCNNTEILRSGGVTCDFAQLSHVMGKHDFCYHVKTKAQNSAVTA